MSKAASPSELEPVVDRAARLEPVCDEVRALAEELSAEIVDAALSRALETREVDGATVLALAVLAQERTPPADVVERLYPDAIDDRAAQLLVAAHPERLAILERLLGSRRLDRFQLAAAAALHTRLSAEPPWPAPLLETLRTLARARPGWVGEHYARQAALCIGDPHLDELYGFEAQREPRDDELFAELTGEPTIDALAPTRSNVLASGFTARRIEPKVGRNDPCPCGSGKKHKKCCMMDKAGRSENLSPVAGVSMREYRRRLHDFLDAEAMLREHPADLARLPLSELSTDQLDACFSVFLDCERMEDAERALDELGTRDLGEELTLDDLRAELVTLAHD